VGLEKFASALDIFCSLHEKVPLSLWSGNTKKVKFQKKAF